MSAQLILPLFVEWSEATPAAADLLAVANAARGGFDPVFIDWKKMHFYPFKTRLLRRHGVPDGADLQIIDLPCNRCLNGVWHSLYSERHEICYNCGGTGVYRTDAVVLQRWLFGGRVFHEPTKRFTGLDVWDSERMCELLDGPWRSKIDGLVKHEPVPGAEARRAWLALLWRFEREQFYATIEKIVVAKVRIALGRIASPLLRPCYKLRGWIYDSENRFAEGLREWFGIQPIPF